MSSLRLYCALSKFIFFRSPVGEEADLGVILFLGVFIFFPSLVRCALGIVVHHNTTAVNNSRYDCLKRDFMLPEFSQTQNEFIILVFLNFCILLEKSPIAYCF